MVLFKVPMKGLDFHVVRAKSTSTPNFESSLRPHYIKLVLRLPSRHVGKSDLDPEIASDLGLESFYIAILNPAMDVMIE